MATTKVYQISIELDKARQDLADAGQLLDALKTKTVAANQEVKETKAVYDENGRALKGLVQEQKALEVARKAAGAGEGALVAQAALDKNAAAQKRLNTTVQESKIDYDNAKAAALAAGKAVADQATTVKNLAGAVKEYGAAAAQAQATFEPGTVGALRAEVEALEEAFNKTTVGTREQEAALLELGKKKGVLKELDDAVDALDPKMKAAAFLDFSNGVVGAFTVATTAATAFGLSQETADKYQQKLLSLISVMSGVEQISKALNSETLSVVKSSLAAAKGYLGMGEAAAAGSKITRAALLATGVGALVVLVGLLVANFDKVKAVAGEIYQKFKPEFDAVATVIDVVIAKARDLASFLSFGLVDDAAKHAVAVAQEATQKRLAVEADNTDRYIAVLKARGDDTLKLEVENARKRANSLLALDKDATAEQKKAADDATKDYVVLKRQLEKRTADAVKAERLAGLNALATEEAALGKSTFAAQLAAKKEQIAQLGQAERAGQLVTAAQTIQLQSELAALENGHAKEQADKRRALLSARLQGDLALLTARGGDEYQLQVKQNALQLKLAQQQLKDLRAAAQPDAAAILTAQRAVDVLKIQQADIFYKEREKQEAAHQRTIASEVEAPYVQGLIREKKYQENLAAVRAGAARVNEQLAAEEAERVRILGLPPVSLADNLLIRVFGLRDDQLEVTKQRFAEAGQQIGAAASSLYGILGAQADQWLAETQTRLDDATHQLTNVQGQISSNEASLDGAKGARRAYLLKQIASERTEEERLAKVKNAAAADQAKAEKEKQKLQKEGQAISAASTSIESILLGIKAAQAIVEASSKGKIGYDNIALAIAATAAIGVSIFAMKNAAKSFADGGVVDGPRHSQGGIQMWQKGSGAHLGEMEGGEHIASRQATANNLGWLDFINSAGKTKVLTPADFAQIANVRVLPPPAAHFAAGGVVGGASALPAGMTVIAAADLSALLSSNQQIVEHLRTVAQATSTTAAYGPPRIVRSYQEVMEDAELLQQAQQAKASVSL